MVSSKLMDHLLLPSKQKVAALWKEVEGLLQVDSQIDQYPKLVNGDSWVVWEWPVALDCYGFWILSFQRVFSHDWSRMISKLNDVRAHSKTDDKILWVRLEGLEKENFGIKYKVHSITKELEIRCAELEYEKESFDALSCHHAKSVKFFVRLEDECSWLRVMVRKRLPSMISQSCGHFCATWSRNGE